MVVEHVSDDELEFVWGKQGMRLIRRRFVVEGKWNICLVRLIMFQD